MDLNNEIWTRTNPSGETYVATARRDWIGEAFVSAAFNFDQIYWASATTPSTTKHMLDNSLTLSLYLSNSGPTAVPSRADLTQIGMVRMVTDQVTIVFVADVVVAPEHQGKGLGGFLMDCVKDMVEEMKTHEAWRRMVLLTSKGGRPEGWYKRVLDMETAEDLPEMSFMTTKRRLH